ncbi:MAG: CinA family protein [Candidatus Acetothermia bacterium]
MSMVTYVGEDLLEKVGRLLRDRALSISLAESCTGGLVSHLITNVSGSSDYFDRGLVTYSNRAKMELLGVRSRSLEEFGAVSQVVAEEMAEGVRRNSGTSLGLSTTGIAGPTGGTPEKPVGLVFVAAATSSDVTSKRFVFDGDRLEVKQEATEQALGMLVDFLGR